MELREDVSGFLVRLDDKIIAAKSASGVWRDRTLGDYAFERAEQNPDALLYVDNGVRLSRAQILRKARQFGAALRQRGLRSGDVVSFQLPNWHETAVVHLAAALEGFVANPIVPIYRDAEVQFILSETKSKVFVVPGVFRNFDYRDMLRRICADLPDLREVVVVRDEHMEFSSFEDLLGDLPFERTAVDPNAVKLVMYTSGTTGPAKGVLHSHNTMMVEIDHYGSFFELGQSDAMFMASPLSHVTGLNWAVECALVHGFAAVLVDRWDAESAVAIMRAERCTITVGATVFLQETVAAAQRAGETLPDLKVFLCGGATVPPSVIRAAHIALPHTLTARLYGSTEMPTITYGVLLDSSDKDHAAETDGRIVGWDVKICDPETGAIMPPGEAGEILGRGDEMLIGYSRPADTLEAFDSDGYFRSGDIGRIVDDHYLVITDRKKDLIIRGGENLSSKEIEDALQTIPGIGPVAVIAMPCARMGEAVCAVIEERENSALTVEAAAKHLHKAGISKRKFPERVIMIDALPRTAAGKVMKAELRRRLFGAAKV